MEGYWSKRGYSGVLVELVLRCSESFTHTGTCLERKKTVLERSDSDVVYKIRFLLVLWKLLCFLPSVTQVKKSLFLFFSRSSWADKTRNKCLYVLSPPRTRLCQMTSGLKQKCWTRKAKSTGGSKEKAWHKASKNCWGREKQQKTYKRALLWVSLLISV